MSAQDSPFSNLRSCITICSQRGDAGICPLLPMTRPDRLWFWIAKPIRRKAVNPPAPGSDVLCAVGRQRKRTCGPVTVATCGIRSTPAACARHACTRGPRRNAFPVNGGLRIPTGTGNDCLARRLCRPGRTRPDGRPQLAGFLPGSARLDGRGRPSLHRSSDQIVGLRRIPTRICAVQPSSKISTQLAGFLPGFARLDGRDARPSTDYRFSCC